jgi:drug/metabolite transporter (DMT)-like permease
MTLRSRKIICFALTAAAGVVRIADHRQFQSQVRKYFSVAISAGIALMCGFVLLPAFSNEQRASSLLVLLGLVLIVVALAVLVEMHTTSGGSWVANAYRVGVRREQE